jgi:sulfur carrier protein
MKVKLRNPDRELDVPGPRRVRDVLADLNIDPDTVLVIRNKELVTREERLDQNDEIEVRPVISGGRGGSNGGRREAQAGRGGSIASCGLSGAAGGRGAREHV